MCPSSALSRMMRVASFTLKPFSAAENGVVAIDRCEGAGVVVASKVRGTGLGLMGASEFARFSAAAAFENMLSTFASAILRDQRIHAKALSALDWTPRHVALRRRVGISRHLGLIITIVPSESVQIGKKIPIEVGRKIIEVTAATGHRQSSHAV